MKLLLIVLGALSALSALVAGSAASAFDDDVYGESALPRFDEPEAMPEQALVLPPYPRGETLILLDVNRDGGAFSVLIDPGSISIGADGVVRYTVVMRSGAGVENVVFEGLRCDDRQYRRYAYGSDGLFQPVTKSTWKFVRKIPRDRYRIILLDDYFCPATPGSNPDKIRKKLQGRS